MIPTLRRSQILEILQASGLERLPGLAQKMGISESTLRRDLKELALRGEVELLRGGGVRMRKENIERGINEKILLNREEKERIARYAAELIHDNDVVYLDPSSLNCILADYIHANNVKVVTNSFELIRKLMEKGIVCVLVGGDVKMRTSSCVGPFAQQMMQDVRFTKSFIGANGLSVTMGLTSHDSRERAIKQIAIANSQAAYFLVDSNKYGDVAMYKIADIDACPVITGKYFDDFEALENIIVV